MKLTFLGTKGYIEPESRRHRMHTALLVSYLGRRVMVDCGSTWQGKIGQINPHAIVLTHFHPDHVSGLTGGERIFCPVYASRQAWEKAQDPEAFTDIHKKTLLPEISETIMGMKFTAFPVLHSTRAPAVGYRITAGRVTIFFVPDVVYIEQRKQAMKNVRLYIGDGASLTRSLVRKSGHTLIGHTPVRTQLTWCAKENVPEMIVTHCGAQIVSGDERKLGAKLRKMAAERGVKVSIAHDGMEKILR